MLLSRFYLVTVLICAVVSCPQVAKTIAKKEISETTSNVAIQQEVAGVRAKQETQTNVSEVTDKRAIDIRGDHPHERENGSCPRVAVAVISMELSRVVRMGKPF